MALTAAALAPMMGWADCTPPEQFDSFSDRFVRDRAFRDQRTAEVVVVQRGQEDLVAKPKLEKLKREMLEERKLAIRTPEQLERGGLLQSKNCAKGVCAIQQYAEGTDLENAYYFLRKGGCWQLTRITNAM